MIRMDRLITLRTELESEIQRQGYSLSSFSKASGINRGILSATLNGNPPKPMSINQLDGMVKALGKPEGWLYELFVEECFNESGKTNWRRVRPLLLRCVDLHQADLIRRTLDLLMENPAHVSHVFDMAEELVAEERGADAVPLYQCVIENERNYQSERLAVSQYRLFRAALGHNIEDNLKAALIFESFRNRLPAHLKLDALLKLGNVYYTVQDWNATIHIADESYTLCTELYEHKLNIQAKKQHYKSPKSERPALLYYGQSILMKFVALEHSEKYKEARPLLQQVANLDWFQDEHPENHKYIDLFKFFAHFNHLNLELLTGNPSVLREYAELLEQHPEEALPSLLIILKAANKHQYDIDYIINDHQHILYPDDLIDYILNRNMDAFHKYSDTSISISRYVSIYYELAIYYCNRKVYDEKLEKILQSLEHTVAKYNRARIMDCINLFKKLKELKS